MEETKKKKKLWFRILIGILITLAVFLAVLAGVFFLSPCQRGKEAVTGRFGGDGRRRGRGFRGE